MEMGVRLGGGGGGGGRVGIIGVIEEDMGDGMQCSEHPYRNNPGGICAFCLQEKLGKLVSSSSPLPIHPFPSSSPGSSSPSFRSEVNVGVSVSAHATNGNNNNGSFGSASSTKPNKLGHEYDQFHTKRAKLPFLLTKKKKKTSMHGGSDRASNSTVVTFKRSKSTVTPRRSGRFLEDEESFSPRKRNGFWSFLSLSSSSRLNGHGGSNILKKVDREKDCTVQEPKMAVPSNNGVCMKKKVEISEEDDVGREPNCHVSPAAVPSFERKVSRSRSVGCGSRSFSGDFFERISTGFGDCTLRRVESQREGKQKVAPTSSSAVYGGAGYDPHHHHQNIHHHHGQQFIKERVKCGGIFGGFMMTSSSSSSICSSSTYWVNPSSNNEDVMAVKSSSSFGGGGSNNNNNGRNPNKSSWSWAFASPMRAFSKTSSKENGKKDVNKNATPNLDAIPSLLTVSS